MSYLLYLCLSLPPVVCRRAHVLFTLSVFVFTSCCLQEGSCLIYFICVCLYLLLFVGGHMSYLLYLCLSLPPVVCRRAHVLFTLFVGGLMSYLRCLQEGSCLIYAICVCLWIVVSSIQCVMLLLCFSTSCVPCVATFSGLSILIPPAVFSSVYLEYGMAQNMTFHCMILNLPC